MIRSARAALSAVIAGLDPAIHAAGHFAQTSNHSAMRRFSMDARVKPAHDE